MSFISKKKTPRRGKAKKRPINKRAAARKPTGGVSKAKGKTQARILAPETFPHFRHYKKSGHPALIVGEHSTDEYRFRKVMHAKKDGGRTNEEVYPNPNSKDPNPMYIGKRKRHDLKENFGGSPLPWKYPKEK